MGGPIYLTGTIGFTKFVYLVAVGGTKVENNCKGIKLAVQAHYKRQEEVFFCIIPLNTGAIN